MSESVTEHRDGAQSIRRTVLLFDVLAGAPARGYSLSEIAKRAELSSPTVHRILKVLLSAGAVEQNPATRLYRLGPRVPIWAAARPAQVQLVDVAEPYLAQASKSIGLAAFLSYRTGLDATCLTSYSEVEPLTRLVPAGARRPLGFPACSIAMLAALDEKEAEIVIKRNQDRLKNLGVTIHDAYLTLQQTRTRGFAMRAHGAVTKSTTLSIVIEHLAPKMLATLTVSQNPNSTSKKWIEQAVYFMKEGGAQISNALSSRSV